MLLRWALLAISFANLAYSNPLSTPPDSVPRQRSPLILAPLLESNHVHGTVDNSYIVILKNDVSIQSHLNFLSMADEADPLLGDAYSGLGQVYDGHIKGYSGRFTKNVVDMLRARPEVAYVERDQFVRTMDMEVQKSAPWGLARISHRPRLNFSTFTKYIHDPVGGEGVDVYVIDTGINIHHQEFQGRATWGHTVPINDVDEDGNGHGTHCAGTIASRRFGVAKSAHVIAVKVLGSNGSGTMSDVVGGVVWATKEAIAKAAAARAEFALTGKTKHKGSVANMSLGGGKSQALDDAVNQAVTLGLHFAVAAGNDNRDACQYSPAGAEKAVTVGASNLGDERAYFSNHGSCVDVFAPGVNIMSTWTGTVDAINTISGTSMASPHTAGLLAYLLSLYPSEHFDPFVTPDLIPTALEMQNSFSVSLFSIIRAVLPSWASGFIPTPQLVEVMAPTPKPFPTLTPAQLKAALLNLSTKGIFGELPPKTPNLLIFNNATA